MFSPEQLAMVWTMKGTVGISKHWHSRFRLVCKALIIIMLCAIGSCSEEQEEQSPCDIYLLNFDPVFGVQYDKPERYRVQGLQSDLDSAYFIEVYNALGELNPTVSDVVRIAHWVGSNFSFVNRGGQEIGKKTVNELFEVKEFYGCHSQALLVSSIARAYGMAALLVETASVRWAREYRISTDIPYSGHVMTEVYVDGSWILLDNNGAFVRDYQQDNPFISPYNMDSEGLFTLAKGLDSWDYGVEDPSDTHAMMERFSTNMHCLEMYFDSVTYAWE